MQASWLEPITDARESVLRIQEQAKQADWGREGRQLRREQADQGGFADLEETSHNIYIYMCM